MNPYVKLARQAVEEYVGEEKVILPLSDLPTNLYSQRSGVFVTIYKMGESGKKFLRGCVGTFLPTQDNVIQEIISNAVAACSRDNRFSPVKKEELPFLVYEVSILSEPCPVEDLKNHDPRRHGLIVSCPDGRCGLLLPNLEGIHSADEQFFLACQKGGINPEIESFKLYQFTTEKYTQEN